MDSLLGAIEAQRNNPLARHVTAMRVTGATPPLTRAQRYALAEAVGRFSAATGLAPTRLTRRAFNSVMTLDQIRNGKFGTVRANRLGAWLAARWPEGLAVPSDARKFIREVR